MEKFEGFEEGYSIVCPVRGGEYRVFWVVSFFQIIEEEITQTLPREGQITVRHGVYKFRGRGIYTELMPDGGLWWTRTCEYENWLRLSDDGLMSWLETPRFIEDGSMPGKNVLFTWRFPVDTEGLPLSEMVKRLTENEP